MRTLYLTSQELGVEITAIIRFLQQNNIQLEKQLNPEISDEAYKLLQAEFENKAVQIKSNPVKPESSIRMGPSITGSIQLPPKKGVTTKVQLEESKYSYYTPHRNEKLISRITIGKVLFIDYSKNMFGFLGEARYSDQEKVIVKVYFRVDDVIARTKIIDGNWVIFEVYKGKKGYFAKNVKTINECELEDAKQLLQVADESNKILFISRIMESEDFSEDTKKVVGRELLKLPSTQSWLLLNNHFGQSEINEFQRKHLYGLSCVQIKPYLSFAFNKNLFLHYLSKYEFDSNYSFFRLLQKIRKHELSMELPNSFIEAVKNIAKAKSVDVILSYYEELEIELFIDLAIANFSFRPDTFSFQLFKITNSKFFEQDHHSYLIDVLEREIEDISCHNVIILNRETNLIPDSNYLFNLLKRSRFHKSCLKSLSSRYKIHLSNDQILFLYDRVKRELDYHDYFSLITSFQNENEVADQIRVDFLQIDFTTKQYEDLLGHLSFGLIKKPVVFKYACDLSVTHVEKSILHLVKFLSGVDISLLKNIIRHLDFSDKGTFFRVRDLVLTNPDVSEIFNSARNQNRGLVDYLLFYCDLKKDRITKELNDFIAISPGFLEVSLCKRIICKFHHKKINRELLFEILDEILWTDISAILIKTFIKLSTTTDKIILDTLNLAFKSHFELLGQKDITRDQFLSKYTIQDIVNSCDGRKSYNGEFWQRENISRWYINGETPNYSTGATADYSNRHEPVFCEGRFWKKGDFFNNNTNERATNGGDLFWCRGAYCAAVNDRCDLNQNSDNWTLSEIATVFNLSVDRLVYTTLAGWANRMNEIIDRLICRNCDEVLRPIPFTPKTLGYNAVPIFNCINSSCSLHKKTIRFTHCLNGKCNNTLDSRDCESCKPSDPYHIGMECNECGSSCPQCSGGWNGRQVEY